METSLGDDLAELSGISVTRTGDLGFDFEGDRKFADQLAERFRDVGFDFPRRTAVRRRLRETFADLRAVYEPEQRLTAVRLLPVEDELVRIFG